MESLSNNVGYGSLAVFIALAVIAASPGAIFQPGSWYDHLSKPAWTPPNWLFPPAWTVLYGCIVAAGWLVWRHGDGQWTLALTFWVGQLIFNAAWSGFFFGLRTPMLALIDLLLMLACVIGFVLAAWPISRNAALLFLPYAAWVSFAGALNFAVWRMNDWPAAAQSS